MEVYFKKNADNECVYFDECFSDGCDSIDISRIEYECYRVVYSRLLIENGEVRFDPNYTKKDYPPFEPDRTDMTPAKWMAAVREYEQGKPRDNMEDFESMLRSVRDNVVFPIINRGKLWYDRLTPMQKSELEAWYEEWLDVTKTLLIPTTPGWLKDDRL